MADRTPKRRSTLTPTSKGKEQATPSSGTKRKRVKDADEDKVLATKVEEEDFDKPPKRKKRESIAPEPKVIILVVFGH